MISILTIGGSDTSGGAGIQADLKTFASLNCHGLSVVTAITSQTSNEVVAIEPVSASALKNQLSCTIHEKPSAIKIGMLFSSKNIRIVAKAIEHLSIPIVMDTPMLPTSDGLPLLEADAILELKKLFQAVTLITPNLPEAETLLNRKIKNSTASMKTALIELASLGAKAVLLKGGHLRTPDICQDLLLENGNIHVFTAPRIKTIASKIKATTSNIKVERVRGTGCTLSACIAVFLGKKIPLSTAVELSKQYINSRLSNNLFNLQNKKTLFIKHV